MGSCNITLFDYIVSHANFLLLLPQNGRIRNKMGENFFTNWGGEVVIN